MYYSTRHVCHLCASSFHSWRLKQNKTKKTRQKHHTVIIWRFVPLNLYTVMFVSLLWLLAVAAHRN